MDDVVSFPAKRCPKCKETKPAIAFGKRTNRNGTIGLQAWCKLCLKSRDRVELIEYECEECHQINYRRATSPSKKVRARTLCTRCSRRKKLDARRGHSHNYKGTEYFPGRTICSWKSSAAKRGHSWSLTHEQLDAQYKKQRGLCALTGLKMGGGLKSMYRPSIDRIDSAGDYVPGNFQFVCSVVNVMKNKIPEPEFIRLCGLVAQHRGG